MLIKHFIYIKIISITTQREQRELEREQHRMQENHRFFPQLSRMNEQDNSSSNRHQHQKGGMNMHITAVSKQVGSITSPLDSSTRFEDSQFYVPPIPQFNRE